MNIHKILHQLGLELVIFSLNLKINILRMKFQVKKTPSNHPGNTSFVLEKLATRTDGRWFYKRR